MTPTIISWIWRAIVAVIVFLVVDWLLPLFLAYVRVHPPTSLVYLIALACALAVLFYPYIVARRV